MNESWEYYTDWNKTNEDRYVWYHNKYIWETHADIENKLMVNSGERERREGL